jgi:hypothetical protein
MSQDGNARRLPHEAELPGALKEAKFVKDVPRIGELKGRYGAPPPAPAILNPSPHLSLKGLVCPQGQVDLAAILEQPGEDVVDIAEGEGVIEAQGLGRLLRTQPRPVIALPTGVVVPAKEHRFPGPASRQEDQNSVRLLKPREIEKI